MRPPAIERAHSHSTQVDVSTSLPSTSEVVRTLQNSILALYRASSLLLFNRSASQDDGQCLPLSCTFETSPIAHSTLVAGEEVASSTDSMASEKRNLATAAPVFAATISAPEPVQPPTDTSGTKPDEPPSRTRSLKRTRQEANHYPTNLGFVANTGLFGHPQSPKSPRHKTTTSPGFYAAPLTGAAAMEDQRRKMEEQRSHSRATSENPGHKVMSSLMAGGGIAMSKPSEAPTATTALSEGLSTAANSISIPGTNHYDDKALISPISAGSAGGFGLSSAQTAIAGSPLVASPGTMNSGAEPELQTQKQGNSSMLQPTPDEPGNRAFSFPGNVLGQGDRGPARGLSLPVPSQSLAPRSPSQKKHKCPYCETEFTRHHNLKSHLLTHSQEKPYVCQTCTMRFRRLHDLKRHMKLHTGERPHVCPKCNRKFARGDALARHSKGQGGCAGRRSSIGGFDGDEDFDESNMGEGDEGMDGVTYTGDASHMSEEDRRRLSLPSIKAQHASGNESYSHSRVPSSYPPVGPRSGQSSGSFLPPNRDRAESGSSQQSMVPPSTGTSQGIPQAMAAPPQSATGSMYSQTGFTESPKPLSPAGMQSHQLGHDSNSISRQRSPSLSTQLQQQQFGRRPSGRNSPPMSLPSPHTSQGPRLPALNLAPPDQRFTLQSQNQSGPAMGSATSPSTMFQPPMGARLPVSPHHPGFGSMDSNNLFSKGENGVLTYVQDLELQVKQLHDKVQMMEQRERHQEQHIARLNGDIQTLRNQLAGQQQQQQHYPLPLPPGSMT